MVKLSEARSEFARFKNRDEPCRALAACYHLFPYRGFSVVGHQATWPVS